MPTSITRKEEVIPLELAYYHITWYCFHFMSWSMCLICESKLTLHLCECVRLVMMLCGDGQCVQQDGDNHQPVKHSVLHTDDTFLTQNAVPVAC